MTAQKRLRPPVLQCPYCRKAMGYLWTQEGRSFFRCLHHGRVVLYADGRLARDSPVRPAAHH